MTQLPVSLGRVSALTISSFRFNSSTDVKGLDRKETDNRMTVAQRARQSVSWMTVGGRRRAGRSWTCGLEPVEGHYWGVGGVNTRGDILTGGRQQPKGSKGCWVHDSRSLMIPYHLWKMWRTEQSLAGLLTDGALQIQSQSRVKDDSLFCTPQIKSLVIALF